MYENPKVVGKHAIYELLGGDPNLLDDENFVKKALRDAAEAAGATLLGLITHKFEPQGVTAVALLSESHLSFHSWPEYSYASIDAFTCGDHTNPETACHSLKYAFKATHGTIRLLRREGPALNHPQSRQPLDVVG